MIFWTRNAQMNVLRLHSAMHQPLNSHVSVESSAINDAASRSAMVSKLLHQRTIFVKERVQVRVIYRQHSAALVHSSWQRCNALRSVLKRTKGFFLNAHCHYQSVVRQNFPVMKHDVFVVSVNVGDPSINDINS